MDRALRQLGSKAPLTIGEPHDPAAYRPALVHVTPGTARALLEEGRADR